MGKHCARFVLAMTLVGCTASRPPGGGAAELSAPQALLTKLQGYVTCLDHAPRVFQIADLYLGRFGTTAPTAGVDVQVQPSADPAECVEAIDLAKTMAPAHPELEAAGEAYAKAMAAVFAVTTAVHGHQDRANPKAYDPAKALASHPALIAAFGEFNAAQGRLFDQVYRLNRTARLEELAAREAKDGRTLLVIADDMMLRAEDLVRYAATPWDHLDALDTTAMATILGGFENAVDELTAYTLANPEQVEASLKGHRLMAEQTRSYVIAAKQLMRRAADKVAYTDAEKIMIAANNEASVIGTPAAMIKAYNLLVDVNFR